MSMPRLSALAMLLMMPGISAAQDGPAFDCTRAESSAEKLVCADPALAALDRRLADRFAAALATAESLDAGAEAAANTLRATQRGWIKGRDDCWKATDLRDCIESAYLQREAELVARFMLEDASDVRELFCGDGARALTVFEFPTELPGIRVEEGDSIHVGAQMSGETPGAYYVGQWGAVRLGADRPQIEDVYGETTDCRFAG